DLHHGIRSSGRRGGAPVRSTASTRSRWTYHLLDERAAQRGAIADRARRPAGPRARPSGEPARGVHADRADRLRDRGHDAVSRKQARRKKAGAVKLTVARWSDQRRRCMRIASAASIWILIAIPAAVMAQFPGVNLTGSISAGV